MSLKGRWEVRSVRQHRIDFLGLDGLKPIWMAVGSYDEAHPRVLALLNESPSGTVEIQIEAAGYKFNKGSIMRLGHQKVVKLVGTDGIRKVLRIDFPRERVAVVLHSKDLGPSELEDFATRTLSLQ